MYAYPGDSRLIDVKTEGLNACGIVRKEGLSIPVRALVLIIDNLVLTPTLEFHSDC